MQNKMLRSSEVVSSRVLQNDDYECKRLKFIGLSVESPFQRSEEQRKMRSRVNSASESWKDPTIPRGSILYKRTRSGERG